MIAVFVASARVSAAPDPSVLIQPTSGSTVGTSAVFTWASVPNAQAYYLYVGTGPGLKDIVNSGETLATSRSVSNLPPGSTLYATIWTKISSVWYSTASSFFTQPLIASLSTPSNGSTLVPTASTLAWNAASGAQSYRVMLGSTSGASDLLDSGETTATSYGYSSLPNNQTIYATLLTKVSGVWYSDPTTFTTTPALAALTAPQDGAANLSSTVTFLWSSATGAQAYYLYVGTAPGLADLVNSGETLLTSRTASGLPAGQTLYTTLWTKTGGKWYSNTTTFATRPIIAALGSPAPGATGVANTTTFTWSPVANSQSYRLILGSSAGASDLLDTGEITATSYSASGLPPGQLIFATLFTKISGSWYSSASSFTTDYQTSSLISPADGASDQATSLTFTWSSSANAQAYYLYVGTAPGASDLVNTGETLATSRTVTGLPPGQKLYATIWTKTAGKWFSSATTLSTKPLIAMLSAPVAGAANVAINPTLTWATVAGAQSYRLSLGSSANASDLYDSGEIAGNSCTATNLPYGQIVYATLQTNVGGTWYANASSFTTQPQIAVLLTPADGAVDQPANLTFQWTSAGSAQAYYLYVGTTPGASNLVNSGETLSTSRAAANLPAGQVLYTTLWTKTGGAWYSSTTTFTTRPATASLISPAPASSGVPVDTTLTWNSVAGAQAYRLQLGTALGSSELLDSGEITTTTATVGGLPFSQTVYATLWTKLGGTWYTASCSFTTQPQVAVLINPTNNAVDQATNLTFQWSPVPGAQAYYLYVGTTAGASDLINSGETLGTSLTAASLPAGQTIFVTLWTKTGGAWYSQAASFATRPIVAALASPTSGSAGISINPTLSWSPVAGAQTYRVLLGTSLGGSEIANSGDLVDPSFTASALPYNQLVYVTLQTEINGTWYSATSSFTTQPEIAVLQNPTDGATDIPASLTFQWSSAPSAQSYYLYVGSTPDASDLVNSGETLATTYIKGGLPQAQLLYVTLWTRTGGKWYSNKYSFTTRPPIATLNSPAAGTSGVVPNPTLSWDPAAGAEAYHLLLGTTPGASDLADSGEINATAFTATGLPYNQVTYATLSTKTGGTWYSTSSNFTTAPQLASLVTPGDGAADQPSTLTFTWNAADSAQYYYLYAGSSPGSSDIINSGEMTGTSYTALALPIDKTIYTTLWTKSGGAWYSTSSTFTTRPVIALLGTPVSGSNYISSSPTLTWDPVPDAQAYRLLLGSSPGASDLADSGPLSGTSYTATGLPFSQTIYVTLLTELSGVWHSSTSTFTTQPVSAVLQTPVDGATDVPIGLTFRWNSIPAADSYYLYVGTTPGAQDVVDSGMLNLDNYVALGLPQGQLLYATLWTSISGHWVSTASSFTTQNSTAAASSFVFPQSGQSNLLIDQPFEWSDPGKVQIYRVIVGTSAGSSDVCDSGPIHSLHYFPPTLPTGVTLYGQLQILNGNAWQISDSFTISTSGTSISTATRIETAMWATDFVRRMADNNNTVIPGTLLEWLIYPHTSAVCTDCSLALLVLFQEMNLGLNSQHLDIWFNPGNSYDGHTLVEIYNPDTQSWILVDPTFDLSPKRTSDGRWATAEDMMQSVRTESWGDISYVFHGAAQDQYARAYYLDYPLLFLNVRHEGDTLDLTSAPSLLPYLSEQSVPQYSSGFFALRTEQPRTVDFVNGVTSASIGCDGIDNLSAFFFASSIDSLVTPSDFQLYIANRYVF